ncbi:MAG: translocation/assembly module TamB [Alphaproteobacteria bacterium]|nr:translocation/assembly module TamB [Alphaproteobacteria bacterium]
MKTYTKAILGFIVCINLLFLVLQIPLVKKAILEKALEYALNEPKHKIIAEGVKGFLPFSLKVQKISFKDPVGTWLELDDLKISVKFLPFKVNFFDLKTLNLQRIPAFENMLDISLPEIIPLVATQTVVRSFKVGQILIAPQILGRGYEASLQLQPNAHGGQNLELSSSTEGKVSTTFISQIQAYKKGISVHFKGNEIPSGIFSALLKEQASIPEGNILIEGDIKTDSLKVDTDGDLIFLFTHSEWGKIEIKADQKEKSAKGKAQLSLINQKPYTLEAILDNKKEDGFLITFFKLLQEGTFHVEGDALVSPKTLSVPDQLDIKTNMSVFSNQGANDKPLVSFSSTAAVNFKQKLLECKGKTKEPDGISWLEDALGKQLEWTLKANFEKADVIQLEKIIFATDKGHHLDGDAQISKTELKGKFRASLSNMLVQGGKSDLILLETILSGSMQKPTLLTKVTSSAPVPLHIKEVRIEGNLEAQDLWLLNLDVKGGENKIGAKVRCYTNSSTADINVIADLKDLCPWQDVGTPLHFEANLDHTLSGKVIGAVKDLKLAGLYFSAADLSVDLAAGKGGYQLKATGQKRLKNNKAPHKILSSQGYIDLIDASVTVKEFNFTPENHKIILKNPFTVDFKIGKLESFLLALDGGKIAIEKLQWQTPAVPSSPWKGHVSLDNIPFSLMQLFDREFSLQGALSGHIDVGGDHSFPTLMGQLNISSLSYSSFAEQQIKGFEALSAEIDFDWGTEALKWKMECYGGPTLTLFANGKINTQNGYVRPNSEVQIETKGSLHFGIFSAFLTNGDRINGVLTTDLGVHGTVENPSLKGSLNVNSGLYELSDYGTLIHDINLSMEAKGSELVIVSLTAHDGNYGTSKKGILTGKGSILLKSWAIPYVDIELDLEDFKVAQSDSFVGKASGSLFLKGEGEKAKITGDVKLVSASLFLEEAASPEIPTINIANLNPQEASKETNIHAEKPAEILPIELKLTTPSNFNISGFGLESSWKGSMTVVNSLLDTQLVGIITLEKGKLDIFGKTLKLKQGKIIYDTNIKNDPLLFIKAVREVDSDTRVTLIIEGRASNPRFTFMSIPAYPEEEILSRLLFGKSVGSISVGQSIQLASAAAAMNGQKGLNVMDKIRSSFGLDTLELKESKKYDSYDTSGGQALSIGKEFGNVKVSIDQGVSTGTSKATLEAGIAHNLNVNVDVGGDQSSGIGLNWVKRY